MRRSTPRSALLALILRRSLTPAGVNIQCPVCGVYYDPSDTQTSYPHNNHHMP